MPFPSFFKKKQSIQKTKGGVSKLFLSMLIDFVGMLTYLIPGVGEVGDTVWAPISAYLIYYLYGGAIMPSIALLEEVLPGTDILPTATISWCIEKFGKKLM
eukprot:TRINITY_DN346_c0_g1_i1.p1 TRINITY_DN346_c0_g1~~TRINITY_DN346_c0_g1_i1.p1  ORF type:complete len:101 (+),score=18.62 TRINITY_DN346_c0_g1_i1:376-678(+)